MVDGEFDQSLCNIWLRYYVFYDVQCYANIRKIPCGSIIVVASIFLKIINLTKMNKRRIFFESQ